MYCRIRDHFPMVARLLSNHREKDDFWDLLAMARSAYYAEVQRELWYKFRKENEDLTSIVIGTFITSSYVDIVLTFKDGEKVEKHCNQDNPCYTLLDAMICEMIFERELGKEMTQKSNNQ